jgi:hypothetical protein
MKSSFLYQKIRLPRLFHLLHGKEPALYEILITYLAAFITSLFIYPIINQASFSELSKSILLCLTLDLAGGLVANATATTAAFYSRNPNLRTVYLYLHILHPIVLVFLFPEDLFGITLISMLALASAFFFHLRRNLADRMLRLALLLLAIILLTFLLPLHHVALQILLLLFFFKMQVSVLHK